MEPDEQLEHYNPYGELMSGIVGSAPIPASKIARATTYTVTGIIGIAFLVAAIGTLLPVLDAVQLYRTDLFVASAIFLTVPYGVFYLKDKKKRDAIDAKLPDFLRDLAESARAGLTLPRALVTAQAGEYGALNREIRIMAAQVSWGISFSESLQSFAKRTKTPLILRVVDLITEADRAGGNMVDVLTTASEDARELQQIQTEREQQMITYGMVIYVAYFVFLAVVMILVTQFVPSFKEAVVGLDGGAQVGGLNIKDFSVEEFNTLFYQAAIIQAIGGGLVGGVLTKGTPVAGLRSVLVMVAIAFVLFRVIL